MLRDLAVVFASSFFLLLFYKIITIGSRGYIQCDQIDTAREQFDYLVFNSRLKLLIHFSLYLRINSLNLINFLFSK